MIGVPIQTNITYVNQMIEQGVPIQTNRTYVSPMIEQGIPIQTNRTYVSQMNGVPIQTNRTYASPMIEQGIPIQTNRTYVSQMNGVPIQTNRTYVSPMILQGVPIQTNRTYVNQMIEQGVPIPTNRTYVSPMIEQVVPRVSHGTRHWTAEHWFLGSPPACVWDACHHSSLMFRRLVGQFSPSNVHKGGLNIIISICSLYMNPGPSLSPHRSSRLNVHVSVRGRIRILLSICKETEITYPLLGHSHSDFYSLIYYNCINLN